MSYYKKAVTLFSLIFFAALLTHTSVFSKTSGSSAKAEFKELNFDFGNVIQGPVLEHVFIFTNTGDSKLIIQSVQPSCGCTGASTGDKKEFDAGEQGEIKVTFNTEGRTGVISKTITVTTNDPVNPQVILSFKCEIQ